MAPLSLSYDDDVYGSMFPSVQVYIWLFSDTPPLRLSYDDVYGSMFPSVQVYMWLPPLLTDPDPPPALTWPREPNNNLCNLAESDTNSIVALAG